MFQKTILLMIGLCLIGNFGCEVNKNPLDMNCADTTDGNFRDSLIARKPNIYIYPLQRTDLSMEINFPLGGSAIESIPLYNSQWNINVEPSGLINNQYTYLFYECKIPDHFQYESGWQVAGNDLNNFFTNNLSKTGFNSTEISDFIEYWIPIFDKTKNYDIFPQFKENIDPVIRLNFSVEPESVLRLFYVIRENNKKILDFQEPVISAFERIGFTVVEWGVILK